MTTRLGLVVLVLMLATPGAAGEATLDKLPASCGESVVTFAGQFMNRPIAIFHMSPTI
jgi:hypothetical protein